MTFILPHNLKVSPDKIDRLFALSEQRRELQVNPGKFRWESGWGGGAFYKYLDASSAPLTSRLVLSVRRDRCGTAGIADIFDDPDHPKLFISHQRR